VSAQRQQYKTMHQMTNIAMKRSSPLTQERINLLNQIGFTWTIRSRDTLGESWNHRLEELKRFKAKHGHCMVPSRYAESPELGIWVGTQRTQYRLYMKAKESGAEITGTSLMDEHRIRLLEELGFVWALRVNVKEDGTFKKPADNADVSAASNVLGSSATSSTGQVVADPTGLSVVRTTGL
jgi:hypothetical protein